ncbi:CpcT/CpeT family chromophore lyase [Leptolyngbya sp. FACHB-261]|uniref:chromophore lyase CpcT/CpeT n=1 Tax=Leptolyngbya sp. FACHB-261 TaxID=2692806 RepID=UPI001687FDF3|nr:CpcT/CpeT family chromophore lyase [Leptolyngbya sp. FACHB-261]MBD2102002.1 chromophore lyase CpcT/CpeT [Leptolyngbya sp. FACHB-261]
MTGFTQNSESLSILARCLAGEFENSVQALDAPTWFVHLRLWQRPLPQLLNGNLALFAEQANALYLQNPYRQRILTLQEQQGSIQVQYFAFKEPDAVQGAGADLDRLAQVNLSELQLLPGCVLTVAERNGVFYAESPSETKCYFEYQGEQRQVILGFEASVQQFRSYDRGVDPETGKVLWGAMMGPYEFVKRQDFAGELPL